VGKAAVTSNNFGKGKAIYLGADLTGEGLAITLMKLAGMAGVKPVLQAARGVEVTVRRAGGKQWTFLLNHSGEARSVDLPGRYTDVVSGTAVTGRLELKGYDARVLIVS
jgi:beta-galactosidase